MESAPINVLNERHASNDMNVRQPLARGVKRPATATAGMMLTKENIAPTPAGSASKITKAVDTSKALGGNKFGFRAAPMSSAPIAAAIPQAKRRKTAEFDDQNGAPAAPMEDAAAAVEPLILGPCDEIATLWRDCMMDDAMASECKTALAGKISAAKFDYKEKIGQLEAQMKSLRKVVSTLLKKQDTFLVDAGRIELSLNESILRERSAVREGQAARAILQEKVARALELLKTTQGQRDKLLAETKSNAASLSAHAQVLGAKEAEKAAIQEKLDQTSKDLLDTMSAFESATAEREEAKRMLVAMQSSLDDASVLLASVEEEKAALMKTCETQESDLDDARARVSQLDSDLASVRDQHLQLMGQWSKLQREFEQSESNAANLQEKLAQITSDLATTRTELEQTQAQLADANHKQVELTAAHNHEMTQLRITLQRDAEKLRLESEHALAQSASELRTTQETLDQLQLSKNLLTDAHAKTNLELVSLRSSLLHTSDKVSSGEVELSRVQGELALVKLQLEKKNEECFVTINSFASIQKFHEERQTILQGEKEALEKVKQELQLRTAQLEATGKTAQTNYENTQAALLEKSTAFEQLRDAHDKIVAQSALDKVTFEGRLGELTAAAAAIAAETHTKVTGLESQVATLTASLESETMRATNLQRELASFKAMSGVSNEEQMENLVKLSMEAELLRSQVKDKGEMASTLQQTKMKLDEALRRVAESEAVRRQLHNNIQELKGNIRVFTRVRPMLHAGAPKVDAAGDVNMLTGDDAVNAIDVSSDGRKVRLDAGNGTKTAYSFDTIFGPNSTQKEVFDEISQLVQSALDGYHVCLFSYGQTGSGKTWTMEGTVSGDNRGIIPRSVEKVLEQSMQLSTGGWNYNLEASFLEIYNETIRGQKKRK